MRGERFKYVERKEGRRGRGKGLGEDRYRRSRPRIEDTEKRKKKERVNDGRGRGETATSGRYGFLCRIVEEGERTILRLFLCLSLSMSLSPSSPPLSLFTMCILRSRHAEKIASDALHA